MDQRSDRSAFPGFEHDPPIVRFVFLEQEQFEVAAGGWVFAAEPRWNDAVIVQHEEIAGLEVMEQVGELARFDCPG